MRFIRSDDAADPPRARRGRLNEDEGAIDRPWAAAAEVFVFTGGSKTGISAALPITAKAMEQGY